MDLSALLPDFATPFLDRGRLIELRLAPGFDLPPGGLLVERLEGCEAFNRGFRYELICLSPDAGLELAPWLGQAAGVEILLADGRRRPICGVVTEAARLDGDGGFGRFRLVLEPALALAGRRLGSRVFQDQTVPEIVAQVLAEHRAQPLIGACFAVEDRLAGVYPRRSYCLQYRESDAAFLDRLLREEGIRTTYTFDTTGALPRHTLVLFDDETGLPQLGAVRFHRQDAAESEDGLTAFREALQVQSGRSRLASFEYKQAAVLSGEAASPRAWPVETSLEAYEPQTLYYGEADELARYARLRQAAREAAAQTFEACGHARTLAVGGHFQLLDHPVHASARFLVTALTLTARNNLTDEATPLYAMQATCLPQGVAAVPEYGPAQAKPTSRGPQTATVVGPPGEEIYTDALGRIRICFHWQRPEDGHGLRDETASTWVRVAQPAAGAGYGWQVLPRVGQEVLVDFLEGDIDRPVVVGVLHNGRQPPPRFSHQGSLPAHKTLSGMVSKEYQGHRASELLFDDTTGALRVRLATDHGATHLEQGWLVTPRQAGEGLPRGEGFELRTELAGAIRAARGLLLSTETGQAQLARAGLLAELDAAAALAQSLARQAAAHQAGQTDTTPQARLHAALRDWEGGSNTAPDEPGGGQPLLAATSPGGLALATPQDFTLAAGQVDLTSQQDANLSLGRRLAVRAREAISLFAQRLGASLIAAAGKIRIEAQQEDVEITSAKVLRLTALEEIVIQAPKITLMAEDAGMTLGPGGITSQTTGSHTQHAGKHVFTGPATPHLILPDMPRSESATDEQFAVSGRTGRARERWPYRLAETTGRILGRGRTQGDGSTEMTRGAEVRPLKLDFREE